MKEEALKQKYGTAGGWKVPEGYFENLPEQIMSVIPEGVPEHREIQVNRWQRFKPYLYLAAMFAGIWLMMQVFANVTGLSGVSLENPPESIAMLMEDAEQAEYYTMPSSLSDVEIEREVSTEYDDMADFEEAFGYELRPEYAQIEINI